MIIIIYLPIFLGCPATNTTENWERSTDSCFKETTKRFRWTSNNNVQNIQGKHTNYYERMQQH